MSELRRKILDASVHLVAEQGVRTVSFREVARRAGVSHQAPYHIFGNHQGIMHAIAQEGFAALSTSMRAVADEAGDDPLGALEAAGVAYVTFACRHVGHFRVMFQQALVDVHDPEAPIAEAEMTFGAVVQLSHAAVAAGYGRGVEGDVLAQLLWSTVHGLATLLVEGLLVHKGVIEPDQEEQLIAQVVGAMGVLLRP